MFVFAFVCDKISDFLKFLDKSFQVICDDLEVRNVDSYGRKKRSSSVEKWLKKSVSHGEE